ncbi:MAG TPA: SRPBCC domain-containing protein [Thermoanaerobaculia bacterium]|jgi:uncharacterized protein YndB with AHSA1/START domain
MADEKKVIAELTINASPEEVWRAISEGEEIKRWFTLDARVTPGEGGAVWMSFGEGMDWEVPIRIWEPNRHLGTVDPAPSTLAVDYYIEARGGETVLRIVHSGFAADAWDDELDTLNSGWRAFLAGLKNYLERHQGEPRSVAYFRHPAVEIERAEAFPRLLAALAVPLVGAGERFEGDLFRGTAEVVAPPINLSGRLESHGGGFLMLEVEPGKGRCRPSVWVSLYGEMRPEAESLTTLLRERVTRAFADLPPAQQ